VPADKAGEFEATWRAREQIMRQHAGFQGMNIMAVGDTYTVSSRWAAGAGAGMGAHGSTGSVAGTLNSTRGCSHMMSHVRRHMGHAPAAAARGSQALLACHTTAGLCATISQLASMAELHTAWHRDATVPVAVAPMPHSLPSLPLFPLQLGHHPRVGALLSQRVLQEDPPALGEWDGGMAGRG
jgi:hypothetical protein